MFSCISCGALINYTPCPNCCYTPSYEYNDDEYNDDEHQTLKPLVIDENWNNGDEGLPF